MDQQAQYEGFFGIPTLWKDDSPIGFPMFPFTEEIPFAPMDIPERLVLGKRVEHFFGYALEESSRYAVLGKNLQIIEEKRTVGELDYLLKDEQTGQLLHVELVCRFYLYDPTEGETELDHWIGPNRKDCLVFKLDKLKKHQFPLLFHNQTKSILDELEISSMLIEQALCFKASLFVPKPLLGQEFPEVNNDCILGCWIYASDFTQEAYGRSQFYIPKKQDWVTDPEGHETWKPFEEIRSELDGLLAKKKAPMLWVKNEEGSVERMFVVWW